MVGCNSQDTEIKQDRNVQVHTPSQFKPVNMVPIFINPEYVSTPTKTKTLKPTVTPEPEPTATAPLPTETTTTEEKIDDVVSSLSFPIGRSKSVIYQVNPFGDNYTLEQKAREYKKIWYLYESPVSIEIPAIGMNEPIQQAETIVVFETETERRTTFQTPDSGVATNKELIAGKRLIFGHSRERNIPQVMRNIAHLFPGDQFTLKSESGISTTFYVEKFVLYDYDDLTVNYNEYENNLVLLQTTAIETTENGWLLDKDEVISKLQEPPVKTTGHLALLVFAKPVE